MRISTQLLMVTGIFLAIACLAIVAAVNMSMKKQALIEAESKSKIMADQYFAIHNYFNKTLKPSLFKYTDPLRTREYFDPVWMSSTHAVREINKDIRTNRNGEYYVKDAARNARSPENEATAFESAFITALNTDPQLQHKSGIQLIDGKPYFVLLRRGEMMEESCLRCHSFPETAPGGLVRLYGAERSFNRKPGEVISAISIRVPLAAAYQEANQFSVRLSMLLLLIIFSLFGVLLLFVKRWMFAPLANIHEQALAISQNNDRLGEKIPLPSGRELHELTEAFNNMSTRLRHHMDNLEKTVQERTAELQNLNGQLEEEIAEHRRTEEELQSKNTELERFTYSVSHDLKSPLITIQFFATQIQRELDTGCHDNILGDLKLIVAAVAKMMDLINDLLELSRVGRIMNAPAAIDLVQLVEDIAAQLAGSIKQRGVEIVAQQDLPAVAGDRQRIAEIMQNLIENAIKYMGDQPAPLIEIGAVSNNNSPAFYVRDNGMGIEPRDHDKIFQLFDKLDAKSPGTGIGLALVKKIVEAYNGKIWLESEGAGHGSCFWFTLPAAVMEQPLSGVGRESAAIDLNEQEK